MNEQKIDELIRLYFEGATSLAEEQALREFFSGEKIPPPFAACKPLFSFFAEERAIEPPVRKSQSKTVRMLPWLAFPAVAASIAILCLIKLPGMRQDGFIYFVDGKRIYDEAAAVESVESKLQMLAVSMQKARTCMSAFEKIQEGGQALQHLNRIPDAFQYFEQTVSDATIFNPNP
jgi:hypothetical protein